MTVLRRASTASRVLELTRQLAEDYDTVPLAEVSRTVREVAGPLADGVTAPAPLDSVERAARRRLAQLSAAS